MNIQLSHHVSGELSIHQSVRPQELFYFDRKGKGWMRGAEGQNYNIWAPDVACDGESLSMRYPSYGFLFFV